MFIEVKNLTHVYMPGTPFQVNALTDVSLDIERGEFIGVIGETGSGKSTLVQHLNGLLKPTSGEIWIEGNNLWSSKTDLRRLRSRIALLFQYPEHQLFEETVFKDVAFGPRNMGVEGRELEERVRYGLEWVELDYHTYYQRSPFSLSGGEKRRVAMAGILSMYPEAIILDEPTASMDPVSRKHFLTRVKRLHREGKVTVIFVTHNMEDIALLAERLFVFASGKLVLQGQPTEIFQSKETLEAIGLGIPVLTDLMQKIRRKGKAIRTDIFSVEDACREIIRSHREGVG